MPSAPDPLFAEGTAHAARLRTDDPARAAALGVVYTPHALAGRLAELALGHAPDRPTVLDPAAGCGMFLVVVARQLWARERVTDRIAWLRERLRGWDVDPAAVAIARRALATAAGRPDADLSEVVVVRDALAGPADTTYDLVIGNPPWVDSTRMDPAVRRDLAGRFTVTRGNWDLCCPFVERALQLTSPRGVHAFVVPDKLASAAYARATRRLLTARGLHVVLDARDTDLGASAQPIAYVTGTGPTTLVRGDRRLSLDLGADPWPLWPDDGPALGTRTLADLAEVCGAATVAEAYAWQAHLASGREGDGWLRVVNSGTIDPWRAHWEARPMRYLGERIARPVLPAHALGPRRLDHARRAKLIVAGLTRRLEVLPDPEGGWLGAKSTTLVLPHDPADVPWLAAWLNSRAASAHYRARFGGLALRGGYLRVGPPQLRALPVPALPVDLLTPLAQRLVADPGDAEARERIDAIVDGHLTR